ncbi:hypothetical protein BS78_08G120800 [Paspalum vaginatum]|nr:hypothetical protein BS78_08G120800 [Paspalum vaginatum]
MCTPFVRGEPEPQGLPLQHLRSTTSARRGTGRSLLLLMPAGVLEGPERGAWCGDGRVVRGERRRPCGMPYVAGEHVWSTVQHWQARADTPCHAFATGGEIYILMRADGPCGVCCFKSVCFICFFFPHVTASVS